MENNDFKCTDYLKEKNLHLNGKLKRPEDSRQQVVLGFYAISRVSSLLFLCNMPN